jgi:hypothetical protein
VASCNRSGAGADAGNEQLTPQEEGGDEFIGAFAQEGMKRQALHPPRLGINVALFLPG